MVAKKVKFTPAEKKLIAKFPELEAEFSNFDSEERNFTAHNPWTGTKYFMNNFERILYMLTMNAYGAGNVREFDRLKYLLLKINSSLYMGLID